MVAHESHAHMQEGVGDGMNYGQFYFFLVYFLQFLSNINHSHFFDHVKIGGASSIRGKVRW